MLASLRRLASALALVGLAAAAPAHAGPYSSLIVFGDSLSDSGNNAIALDAKFGGARTPTPIPSQGFIPTFTYSSGRYSNGPVWVEYLATSLGLSALPSLAGGTNWAFGGATTGPLAPDLLDPFPASLRTQVQTYLGASGGTADASALYVVAGGGNDLRAALSGAITPADALTAYVANELIMINQLYAAGARHILVVNTPDVGKAPALLTLGALPALTASFVADAMNDALEAGLATLPQAVLDSIGYFDVDDLVDQVVANPAAYGMTDVTGACAASPTCIADPSTTLFWDGIHPTTAGHAALATAALRVLNVPEPATLALVIVVLIGMTAARRRA